MSLLTATGLAVGWSGVAVASGLDLDVEAGAVIAVLGANGAGKSTLLATLAGLHPPLSGEVRVGGRPLAQLDGQARARSLAWCGSRLARPLGMSARELVRLGRLPASDWTGRASERDEAVVDRVLASLGAESLATRRVSELSDGELQKVSIARALAQETRIVFLDEPTTHLDAGHRHRLQQTLVAVARSRQAAIVIATHDLPFALELADRLVVVLERSFVHGGPEDLALAGTLDRALGAPGLTFDPNRLEFASTRANRASVHLDAPTGPRRSWAIRAIERAGFVLGPSGEPTIRELALGWELPNGPAVTSLAELVERLRDKTFDH